MSDLYSVDHEILMHKDAHFEGSFHKMLHYYEAGGIGINPEFEVERILELRDLEHEKKISLSLELFDDEKTQVESSLKEYEILRAMSHKKNKNVHALIAEWILSPNDRPDLIEQIVNYKQEAVKPLIEIIKTDFYHDPLYPGFGMMPAKAAELLGMIGDKRAIITLFESLDTGDFFDDETALFALVKIGNPAMQFLLKVLEGKPYNADNEKAAQALVAFKNPEVGKICLNLFKTLDIKKNELLAFYLIMNCESLDEKSKPEFIELLDSQQVPNNLKKDIEIMIHGWNKNN